MSDHAINPPSAKTTAGGLVAMLYGFGRLPVVLRHVPLRHRLRRQSAGAQDDRQRRAGAARAGAGHQHPAPRPLRHPAQRHGAAGLQALVDALRAAGGRAHDLRAARKPGCSCSTGSGGRSGAGLVGDQSGASCSAGVFWLGWGLVLAQHLPHQPFRAVRPAPGLCPAARSHPAAAGFRTPFLYKRSAIRSISASCSPSGRRRP